MSNIRITTPDIGADSAEVIEIMVSVGDQIEVDQSLITLESDKASMEVPATDAGTVTSIAVSVGDQVNEGDLILELEVAASESAENTKATGATAPSEEPAAAASEPADVPPVVEETRVFVVPDIGADSAEVIELSVSVGDQVEEGDTLCVAESDKASLEIPAEAAGEITAIYVSEGGQVSQGDSLVELRTASAVEPAVPEQSGQQSEVASTEAVEPEVSDVAAVAESAEKEFLVPDIGADAAEVIEVAVAVGDTIAEGDTLFVVETDKASVDIPAEASGEVVALGAEVGGKLSMGDLLVTLLVEQTVPAKPAPKIPQAAAATTPAPEPASATASASAATKTPPSSGSAPTPTASGVHAGPAARKLARELGVDLAKIKGSGSRARILKEDIHQFVKAALSKPESTSGGSIPSVPSTDWSKFGDVSVEPMTKIHKATSDYMTRCWLNVPHVTQFDNADVTELEEYRGFLKAESSARGVKMSPVSFLLKALSTALRDNPKLNASINSDGASVTYRKYVNIGMAVDTPAGLVVPVIRDVDQKDIWQLAEDVIEMATKAKEGKLKPKEMQGAGFTISSLGAIGGTGFTPIVSSPQVGILGVSKTSIQPVWDGKGFAPRKLMPLALSYDHRVVNGGDAGRFMTQLVSLLGSVENMWNT